MSLGALFTRREYLEPLEQSGCVGPHNGWTPAPLRTAAAQMPHCYEKSHSWGEFVFDFEFANAYAQRGLHYYPKLVCAVPFTPVPGPRLTAQNDADRLELAAAMKGKVAARKLSGAHILFLPPEEVAMLETHGWLHRQQLRYAWRNRGYGSFDEFLAQLPGKQRRNIRRERRIIAESGFEIGWRTGSELSDTEWRAVFELYAGTYHARGQEPYFNLECLRAWAHNFPDAMLFCLARRRGELAAMAFFFRDDEALYGRHWGARAQYNALHFELCYYQGIAYCIEQGLQHFDAGVQGEHRVLRGFEPQMSHSAHWFAHEGFHSAIGGLFRRERAALEELAQGE